MNPVAEFAKELVAELLNPESAFYVRMRQRYGKSRAEWDAIPDDNSLPYPKTVWDINCGWCDQFLDKMLKRFPLGEGVDLDILYVNDRRFQPEGFSEWTPGAVQDWIDSQDLPAHCAFKYEGRYYDAQNPDGVDDWVLLDYMQYGRGQMTRTQYLEMKGIPVNAKKELSN